MGVIEVLANDYFIIRIVDEIMYIEYLAEYYDYSVVDEGIKIRLEKTKGKNFLVLADIRKTKRISREAKARLSQKDSGIGIIATAILYNSKLQEALFNFFNLIYKTPVPTRMFTDRKKAVSWLKQFSKNSAI